MLVSSFLKSPRLQTSFQISQSSVLLRLDTVRRFVRSSSFFSAVIAAPSATMGSLDKKPLVKVLADKLEKPELDNRSYRCECLGIWIVATADALLELFSCQMN